MKVTKFSPVFGWLRQAWRQTVPPWLPWLALGLTLVAGLTAWFNPGMNGGYVVACFAFGFAALDGWRRRVEERRPAESGRPLSPGSPDGKAG